MTCNPYEQERDEARAALEVAQIAFAAAERERDEARAALDMARDSIRAWIERYVAVEAERDEARVALAGCADAVRQFASFGFASKSSLLELANRIEAGRR